MRINLSQALPLGQPFHFSQLLRCARMPNALTLPQLQKIKTLRPSGAKHLGLSLVLSFVCVIAHAELEVRGAWLKPAVHGLSGVVSMDLVNTGDEDLKLIGAETFMSRATTLQFTEFEAFGRRSLKPVSEVVVPAGSFVSLGENGLHLMLQGVKQALTVGAEVPITLQFKDVPAQTVRIPVLGRAPDERDM